MTNMKKLYNFLRNSLQKSYFVVKLYKNVKKDDSEDLWKRNTKER